MKGLSWQANNGATTAASTTIKAAETGATHYVTKIIITIYAFQDTGTLALTDASTTYFKWLCKDGNGAHIEITFDPEHPFSWGTGKAIVCTGAAANVSYNIVVQGFTKQG